jgi:diaminopimelate decarboxylase
MPQPSPAFPADSRLTDAGRIEVGGCDLVELAREFGTPAYIVAERDLVERARDFRGAAESAGGDVQVAFASKAFPCTAAMSIFAAEGLWCDVASEGELHLALAAGFAPERIVLHGNAKSRAELQQALAAGVELIVIDNEDELELLEELAPPRRQRVLVRVTPDVSGDTHEKISTGQANSKFGLSPERAAAALERIAARGALEAAGVHAHIGSQLFDLEPLRRTADALSRFAALDVWDLGGGLAAAYHADDPTPPSIAQYVDFVARAAHAAGHGPGQTLLLEPGRSLTANAGVTLYTVQGVKRNVSTWVTVDGGMSDNLRPMLYGASYEAQIADRPGGDEHCVLAGKHCESGDVIVPDALLNAPRRGDVVVTAATGAYGYALANNYNGVPRAPVIFCADGKARVVVRRETLHDLTARDVY